MLCNCLPVFETCVLAGAGIQEISHDWGWCNRPGGEKNESQVLFLPELEISLVILKSRGNM